MKTLKKLMSKSALAATAATLLFGVVVLADSGSSGGTYNCQYSTPPGIPYRFYCAGSTFWCCKVETDQSIHGYCCDNTQVNPCPEDPSSSSACTSGGSTYYW